MVGSISGYGSYSPYIYYSNAASARSRSNNAQAAQASRQSGSTVAAHRSAMPEIPVQPVRAAIPVRVEASGNVNFNNMPLRLDGEDIAGMAVRMRMQYDGESAAGQASSLAGGVQEAGAAAADGKVSGAESAQKVMEEAECQTCASRKYQDGSDDPGVSFKTAGHIDADMAPSVVRSHEMEHVVREQAKAQREGRKVVSQSVTLHNSICPECGRIYVSGGTTRTTTAAVQKYQQVAQYDAESNRPSFSAVA